MSVSILNTDAGTSGKTVDLLESDQTITGAKTFDRDPNPPFVVTSGSTKVTNLDSDKWDGYDLPADPNADRIMFWDDSATGVEIAWLTLGTGLSITGTTLNGSTGSKPNIVFTAQNNCPPTAAYATPDTRNAHIVLDFDGATDEEAVFQGVLPTTYASGGLTVEVYCAFSTATSGSVRWQAAIERIDASTLDTDADSFAAFQSAGGTAPGTSGQIIKVTVTLTDGAQMDSLAAGEAFRLKIRRDADGTSGTDDIATDAELFRVVMRET